MLKKIFFNRSYFYENKSLQLVLSYIFKKEKNYIFNVQVCFTFLIFCKCILMKKSKPKNY